MIASLNSNRTHLRELRLEKEKREKSFDEFYLLRIEVLEITNDHLQTILETYDIKDRHWEPFKWQYDHDMNELIKAIEDLSIEYHYK